MIPVAAIGLLGAAAMVTLVVIGNVMAFPRFPRQFGGRRRRQLRRLNAVVDRWGDGSANRVIHWSGFPDLTLHDIRTLLWERKWFYEGQDPDQAGWPVSFTRDGRSAVSTDAPAGLEELFVGELRAAAAADGERVTVNITPYLLLPRGTTVHLAEREGWHRVASSLHCLMRQEFRRGAPDPGTPARRPRTPPPALTSTGLLPPAQRPVSHIVRWSYRVSALLLAGGVVALITITGTSGNGAVAMVVGLPIVLAAVVAYICAGAQQQRADRT